MSWAFFKIIGSITSGMLATLDLTGAKEVFYYPGSAWFTPFKSSHKSLSFEYRPPGDPAHE